MQRFGRFLTVSAIYFGLASAVDAQAPTDSEASRAPSAAQTVESRAAEPPRQDHFEHPMLEQHGSTSSGQAEPGDARIQRRGMQSAPQDGDFRRFPDPGAPPATLPHRAPEPSERPKRATDR